MRFIAVLAALVLSLPALAEGGPMYKPSSKSKAAVDIRTNAYGASALARNAPKIGERAPDFTLPRAGGGEISLSEARKSGPVVVIFYRGHW